MKLQRTPIIISTLTLLLVGAGVFWYEKAQWTKSQETQNESADVTIPTNPPSASDSRAEQEQVWYQIPELGIEIQLPKDIADDLVYEYRSASDQKWKTLKQNALGITKMALFSTKTLISFDGKACALSVAPVGIVIREEGEWSNYGNNLLVSQAATIPLGLFFVYYSSSQSPCAFDQQMYDATYKVAKVFNSIFNPEGLGLNVEEWHSKVRELKR